MTATTVAVRALVFDPSATSGRSFTVVATPAGLLPGQDMFVVDSGRPGDPYWTFGRLTGRTRQCWGMSCPTIERFEVDTVVLTDAEGRSAIWGTPGARVAGTLATRPENVR